jgi:hypothetical protein
MSHFYIITKYTFMENGTQIVYNLEFNRNLQQQKKRSRAGRNVI